MSNAVKTSDNPDSAMSKPVVVNIVIAILLKRLGGVAKITQADIDAIAFNRFDEYTYPDYSFELRLVERGRSS